MWCRTCTSRPGSLSTNYVHCAIFRKHPRNRPLEEMEAKLGATCKGLLPLVAPALPEGYRVVPAMNTSGVSKASEHYLAFVVSDLRGGMNLQFAAAPAPGVRQLLS
jgi:hypothetical protein